ncbi:MAG: M6 family metalloprotease domain-containing protein [Candidatus Hydrogenedentes bacterium]|nr:M6 family metalloprotease domain-containing protein [Candidatus Hydrogenedentota bacterium]
MMSRHFCLAMISVFLVQAGLAAPVAPIVISVQQPDGFSFDVRPRGDEYVSWTETLDGYTVVKEGDTWYYAILSADGTLVASSNAVGPTPPATRSTLPKHLHPPVDPRAYEPRELRPLSAGTAKSLSHTQYMVVVLVNYSDISFTYSDSSFRDLMFGPYSSVYSYYRENSYNHFSIVPASENFGVSNDGIIHVTRPMVHPNLGKADSRTEAAAIFNLANAHIDFQSYDANTDGTVSPDELAVIFVLAGYEKAYGDDFAYSPNVFAHAWELATPLVLDGVKLQPFAMFGERHRSTVASDSHQATIGVMCHEAGHLMLGLPDLYDIDDIGGYSDGIGDWGLMGSGMWTSRGTWPGDCPSHLSAWSKVALNITTPADVTAPVTGHYVLQAYDKSSITRLWVDPYRVREYYLLENRQPVGYDTGVPGSGLLIWHVDDSRVLNNVTNHKWVDLEEADGLADLDDGEDFYTGDNGDPYPGSADNRSFNDTTNPSAHDYTNTPTGIAVTNVPESYASMRVDITPSTTGGTRNHIRFDDVTPPVASLGLPNAIWTAVRYTNDTSMNQFDGFEIYSGETVTVDFYLYDRMVGNVPTTLIHAESGFGAEPGWNRFFLSTPQSFPPGSDRVMVLKIGSTTIARVQQDTLGTVDNRC